MSSGAMDLKRSMIWVKRVLFSLAILGGRGALIVRTLEVQIMSVYMTLATQSRNRTVVGRICY